MTGMIPTIDAQPHPHADDKNKGVVDRSSTVVARDIHENAVAASKGN